MSRTGSTSFTRQNNHFSNTWNYQNTPETKPGQNYQNAPKTKPGQNYKNTPETQNYQNAPETLNRVPTPLDGCQTFPYGLGLPKVEIHYQIAIEHFSKAHDLPKVEISLLENFTPLITAYDCLKWKLKHQHHQAIIKDFSTAKKLA